MSNNVPHIAIYLRLLYGGGAERVMVNLIRAFVERGLKVDLVMNTIEGPYLANVPSQVRIIGLNASRMLTGLPKLVSYLQQEHPTVLLSALHYNNEIALWAKRLSGVSTKLIVCEQNTLSIHARNRRSDRWSPMLSKLFYPWADGIVAVSQGVAKDLADVTGLPGHRISTINNPVITPELFSGSKLPIDHPWFAMGEVPIILGVGRLEEQKDFPTLIRAFALVRKVKPSRLVILGHGKDREQLDNLVIDLGLQDDVAFLGFVNNPYAYMARASVFALSSAWEGLPTVLIEALALGLKVVSTNCESGPVEILDNGKYGELVPIGDVNTMAQAILRALSDNSPSVASDWLQQFTLETVTQKYLDLFGISTISNIPIVSIPSPN